MNTYPEAGKRRRKSSRVDVRAVDATISRGGGEGGGGVSFHCCETSRSWLVALLRRASESGCEVDFTHFRSYRAQENAWRAPDELKHHECCDTVASRRVRKPEKVEGSTTRRGGRCGQATHAACGRQIPGQKVAVGSVERKSAPRLRPCSPLPSMAPPDCLLVFLSRGWC